MPSRPCDTCGQPFEARRWDARFCSSKCRLAAYHHKQAKAQRDRDAKVRLLLKTAMEAVQEARELLSDQENVHG